MTIEPSTPAFSAICLAGASKAFLIISMPASWSGFFPFKPSSDLIEYNKAVPPPGTIPSSTAARVALRASSTLSFLSLTSTSVEPPTLITATPPDNLASLS